MKISPLALAVAWILLGMAHAIAALTIVLDAPVVNAAAGTTLVFTGTLTNTDPTTQVFLNDFQFTAPVGLALQPNTFFANVPGILSPGQSYSGPIFSVMLDAGASPVDYNGTITVIGGTDIFGTSILATASVTVLSPSVTIAVATPDAYEFGPVSGAFTVTRTGGTGISLTVAFSIGGTAVNGSSCTSIAPSVAIPSGASSANVEIVPIPDDIAEGDRTVILTLTPSGPYAIGANAAATVTIHDKPADQWRLSNFGAEANTPPAGDTASWAQDGIANLIKYGLNIAPTVSDAWELPQPTMVNGYLTLSFVPNPNAIDVAFTVEGCTDLATWSASNVDMVTLENPLPSTRQTFRYHYPAGTVGTAFLRLKVNRLQ
jgi:hypothetical protein